MPCSLTLASLARLLSKHRISVLIPAAALCLVVLLIPAAYSAEPSRVLMIYGDSLSAAYGMEEEDGWVALLAEKIREQGYPYRVVNASVSGETTSGGLARLPAMLDAYDPELFLLELGGNDGLRGLPVDNIRQNLDAMVNLASESGARVILAGIQIPPNYGPRYTGPFFEQYAEIAANDDLPLIPFLIDGIAQQPELMQSDGIHPKAEAQRKIVENVWPVLKPLLENVPE
ncbi:MAG: arylesterase [Pseudohongiellaceae bacterium]